MSNCVSTSHTLTPNDPHQIRLPPPPPPSHPSVSQLADGGDSVSAPLPPSTLPLRLVGEISNSNGGISRRSVLRANHRCRRCEKELGEEEEEGKEGSLCGVCLRLSDPLGGESLPLTL